MSQTFAASDVSSHNKPDNLWIIVDDDVYDLTKFQEEHPGGKKSISYLMLYGTLADLLTTVQFSSE